MQATTVHGAYLVRKVNPDRLSAIRKHAGRSILDVGCGNGAYILELADEYDIRGCDYEAFETWEQMPDRFEVQNALDLQLPESSVETITCFEVLEHLPEPLKVLESLRRICTKNVILTVPNCEYTHGMRKAGLTYYHYVDPTHVNFFTLQAIRELCVEAGFKIREAIPINRMDIFRLFDEAYDFGGWMGKQLLRLLKVRQKKQYHLTSLVVAEKE